MPKPTGRPSIYSEALADEIFRRMLEGDSLYKISQQEGMPSHAVMYQWIAANPSFADKIAQGRQAQADMHADLIKDLADRAQLPKNAPNRVDPHGARVAMYGRMWLAERMAPKRWSDKRYDEDVGGSGTKLIKAAPGGYTDPANERQDNEDSGPEGAGREGGPLDPAPS